MDLNGWILASVSFGAGWYIRGSFVTEARVEPTTTCICDCKWSDYSEPLKPSNIDFPFWTFGLIGVGILVLLLSNFALVCRVTFRDTSSGQEKEIQFNVKGKSKGVYGASRGLALTN